MSTERMTDARALDFIRVYLAPYAAHGEKDQVVEHIAGRLRGEAAPEGQAVAYQTRIPTGEWSEASWETYERVSHNRPADARELYERPTAAPAPVAGDAVVPSIDRVLSLADVHAQESREDGVRLLDRGGLLALAKDIAALAQDRASQAGAPDLTDDLDFEPDEDHTIADMANVGYSLMQAIKSNCPKYCWNESPAEIVVDLINRRDEAAQAPQAGAAGVPDGWRLVPVNLTFQMIEAYEREHHLNDGCADTSWAVMLAAAPTPAAEGEVGRG